MLYNQTLHTDLYSKVLPIPVTYDTDKWVFDIMPTHLVTFINPDGTGTVAVRATDTNLEPLEPQTLTLDITFDPDGFDGYWEDSYEDDGDYLYVYGQSLASSLIYNLIYETSEGGSIVGDTNQVITDGFSGTEVTATPTTGYTFLKWSDNNTNATRTDIPNKSVVYTAYFVKSSFIDNVLYQYRD